MSLEKNGLLGLNILNMPFIVSLDTFSECFCRLEAQLVFYGVNVVWGPLDVVPTLSFILFGMLQLFSIFARSGVELLEFLQ